MAEQFDRRNFSGLELLATPVLEEIIRTDFSEEASYSEDMILYVLELIAERKKTEQPKAIPDVQQAWQTFSRQLDMDEPSPFPKALPVVKAKRAHPRGKTVFRYIGIAAACIALLFAMLITVQAMGVDVFGALAQWTDSTFRFEVAQESQTDVLSESPSENGELSRALVDAGLPASLAPTWIPPGYQLTDIASTDTELHKRVRATYSKPDSDKLLAIDIEHFPGSEFLSNIVYEKNSDDPDFYVIAGKKFYIFKNCDMWVATWSDTKYGITISGPKTKEDALSIINSIKDDTNE